METADITNHFRCANCKRYLAPPIIQCVQGHILCTNCSNRNGKCRRCNDQLSTVVHNIFGQIAKRSFFPCSFAENGCDEKFKWTDINEHEIQCHFQNVDCPLSSAEKVCDWQGPITKLENHFCDTHQESLLIAVDGMVTVKHVDLEDIDTKVFLIIADNSTFLCYFTPTNEPDYFNNMAVLLAGTENDLKQYRFEFKVINSVNRENSISFNGVVHPIKMDFIASNWVPIWYSTNTANECQIKIINPAQASVSDSYILDQITCYQCKKYVTPPIYSCLCHTWCKSCKTTSHCGCLVKVKCYRCEKVFETAMYKCKANHNICDNCKNSFNDCCCGNIIIGKSSPGIRRNHQLEPLYERAIAPCSFASVGCTETFKVKERLEHVCKFGNCVQCDWKGQLADLLLHVEQKHELMTNGTFEILDGGNLVQRTIGVNGKAFVLHCIKDTKSDARHFVVQAYVNYSHYKYTVTIGGGNEVMSCTQICTNIAVPYQDVVDNEKAASFLEYKIMSSTKQTIFVERIVTE